MMTYWNQFLMDYPFVSKLEMVNVLELFWHYVTSHKDFENLLLAYKAKAERAAPAVRVDDEKKKTILDFYAEVCAKAEENMLKTGKLEGAHYAAMKEIVDRLRAGEGE